jgi:hypothetical protein
MAGSSIIETVAATAKDDEGKKAVDAEPGNKEAAAVAARTAMVTEQSWIDYVILYKKDQELLAPKEERKADEPTVAMITKETVPDSFIDILRKRRPVSSYDR